MFGITLRTYVQSAFEIISTQTHYPFVESFLFLSLQFGTKFQDIQEEFFGRKNTPDVYLKEGLTTLPITFDSNFR